MATARTTRALTVRGLSALLVALVVTASGTTPAGAQTAPFTTGTGNNHLDPDGTANGIVVVGDDMLVNGGVTYDADVIGDVTGSSVWISAANSASWVNYFSANQQNGYSTMPAYADFFDARITVGALAKNDARIMTQSPASYDMNSQYFVMYGAVAATRAHSPCVLLVNVPERSGIPGLSVANAQAVNANMAWLATTYSGGGVHLGDWKTYSAGQSAWFVAGSAQLTATGAQAYALFIAIEADDLIDNHGC